MNKNNRVIYRKNSKNHPHHIYRRIIDHSDYAYQSKSGGPTHVEVANMYTFIWNISIEKSKA